MRVKQFKMVTGDEIICEVVQWDDDENPELVTRNVMKIVSVNAAGSSYHTLKNWMIMQEGNESYVVINGDHISAQSNPTEEMLKYYYRAVENANLSEEELNAKIDKYINELKTLIAGGDSDQPANVVTFPGGRNIH